MFRAGPQHTGVFDSGGRIPVNSSAWHFTTGGSVSSSPVVADGIVYFGSDDRNLYAINATTGSEKWRYETGNGVASSPAVVRGLVYIGSYDHYLYAIDAATGRLQWKFATGNFISSSPVVADGVVYIGSDDDHLHAIDAVSGKEKWAFATQGDVVSTPAVANGIVYVGSNDKNLYAINAVTGQQQWTFRTRSYVQSAPALSNGMVYVGSSDNNLYGVDAATGTEKWRFASGGPVVSSPAVSDGVVFVGSQDTNIYAVDAGSGRLKWRFATGSYVSSSPAVADGVVYAGSLDGVLHALDAGTGTEKWRFATGSGVYSSPSLAEGIVYVGSYDRNLYAVGGTPAAALPGTTATPAPVRTTAVMVSPTTDPCRTPYGCGPDQTVLVALFAVLVVSCLGGYYLFRSRRTGGTGDKPEPGGSTGYPANVSGQKPDLLQVQTTVSESGEPHGPVPESGGNAFPEFPPAPAPASEPVPESRLPDEQKPGPGFEQPTDQPEEITQPEQEKEALLARIESTRKRAYALVEFRNPVDNLLQLSDQRVLAHRYSEARTALENAEAAIGPLRGCESLFTQWKNQGYDTTRLEAMKSEGVQKIQAAFAEFGQQVDDLRKIRSDLDAVKKQYPAHIGRAEFRSAVASLEQSLASPDHVGVARAELQKLSSDIGSYAQEYERLGENLRTQVVRLRDGISDDSVLIETNGISKLIGAGDFSAADRMFRDLVSFRITHLNETLDALRHDGAVIPQTFSPHLWTTGETDFAERIIETIQKQQELDQLRNLFHEAAVIKDMVKDPRLLAVFDAGSYEQFVTECKKESGEPRDGSIRKIPHDVIISYSSYDKATADAVCAGLESQNIRCWIAPRDILPGEIFQESIITAINESAIMVIIFSSHSNISHHVYSEVNAAMSRGIIMIPFRIENIYPSKAMQYLIGSSHWLDALTPPVENHIRELAKTILILLENTKKKQKPE